LYPAVGAAFNNLKGSYLWAKVANLRDIDCLDDKFIISNCVAARTTFDLISYQIKFSYKDNQLTVEFTDIESLGFAVSQFSDRELESLPRFDPQRIAEQLKTQIEQSLANANVYNSAKKAFIENNTFLYRALSPITEVLMDEFIATLFKGGEISLSASISDVKKNTNAEFKNYTIEISATLWTDPPSRRSFAHIKLYTNDSNLARLKQYEDVKLSGQLVRFANSINSLDLIMTK